MGTILTIFLICVYIMIGSALSAIIPFIISILPEDVYDDLRIAEQFEQDEDVTKIDKDFSIIVIYLFWPLVLFSVILVALCYTPQYFVKKLLNKIKKWFSK